VLLGTSPVDADTDGDGLGDDEEDRNANGIVDPLETSPLVADSDGDGLLDGQEDRDADGLVDPDETDPLHPDSDDDGLLDRLEVDTLGTVFVSSASVAADSLNGIAAGDDHCSTLASAAGLGDRFRAWLSTSQIDARGRIVDQAYALVDGTPIVDGLKDLTDGTLQSPSDKTELNAASAAGEVWTGTASDGRARVGSTCSDWSAAVGDVAYGVLAADAMWTDDATGPPLACSTSRPLYCFGPLNVIDAGTARGADTDGDGLCDGPIAVSGICDAGEDLNGKGIRDPNETDPTLFDTDGDGWNDGIERMAGTDPTDPLSAPNPTVVPGLGGAAIALLSLTLLMAGLRGLRVGPRV
jgi:hypothetical protein